MNMNYCYPTTMYESILAQNVCISGIICMFLLFDMKKSFKRKLQKLFSTRNMYIWAKILSYIVVELL